MCGLRVHADGDDDFAFSAGRVCAFLEIPVPIQVYLTQGVFKVVLQKSISTQIRQLVVHIRKSKR